MHRCALLCSSERANANVANELGSCHKTFPIFIIFNSFWLKFGVDISCKSKTEFKNHES